MVKETELEEQKRTKPDWYYHQVAVIPFRIEKNKLEILLITSIKKKKWILPKGVVEQKISPAISAANEAYEEAGVKGTVFAELVGSYTINKWGGVCNVQVYPMEVDKEHLKWPEYFVRMRKWCSIEEALEYIPDRQLAQILRQFPAWVERNKKPS